MQAAGGSKMIRLPPFVSCLFILTKATPETYGIPVLLVDGRTVDGEDTFYIDVYPHHACLQYYSFRRCGATEERALSVHCTDG